MGPNLLTNGSFETTTSTDWYFSPWYAENDISQITYDGINNTSCIKMTINRTNDPGMCMIYQTLSTTIETGKQYRLAFYARRSGNIDIWAGITLNGTFQHLQSALPQLGYDPNHFDEVEYYINVPSQSSSYITAEVTLIAGSATGTAWFDDVSFCLAGPEENPSIVTYKNCVVKSQSVIYESPDQYSQQMGTVYTNNSLNLYEYDSNAFIRCKYGERFGYVRRSGVSTAESDMTDTRNVSNMFGDTVLQYEYPATERAKVYNLQWTLKRLGFNCGSVDGKFGQGVDSAVRDFQTSKGITCDGKVGSTTKQKLIDALNTLDSI